MLTFRCRVVTISGELQELTETGESRLEVENNLKGRGLQLLSISKTSALKLNRNDFLTFTQTLKILLAAHLSLQNAIELAQNSLKSKKLIMLTTLISKGLQAGEYLSSILERTIPGIPPLYIGLIRVGEMSGNLNSVLSELTTYMEREKTYKDKIRSAMIYPIFILVVTLVFAMVFVWKILPQFNSMFSSLGGVDNDLSARAQNLSIVIYIVILLVTLFTIIIRRKGKVVLNLPVIGPIIRDNETFKLLFALSVLTGNKMDIISSLQESISVVDNRFLKSDVKRIITDVNRGKTLSESFETTSFPDRVTTFIRIGERSGNISQIFTDLSGYYNDLNDRRVEQLMALIDPLFTLLIGVMLTLIVVNFVLPLLSQMGSLI